MIKRESHLLLREVKGGKPYSVERGREEGSPTSGTEIEKSIDNKRSATESTSHQKGKGDCRFSKGKREGCGLSKDDHDVYRLGKK